MILHSFCSPSWRPGPIGTWCPCFGLCEKPSLRRPSPFSLSDFCSGFLNIPLQSPRIKTAARGVFVQIKLLIWEKKSNLFNNNLYEGNSQTYRIKETDDPCGNICPKWSLLVQCLKGSVTLELVAQDSVWNQSSLQVSPVIDQGQLQTEFRRNWAR